MNKKYVVIENITEEPYSLQDAKDEMCKRIKLPALNCIMNVENLLPITDGIAELYKEKATEKLRKERDALKIELSNYAYQIDRAKRDRDAAEQKAEELTQKLREYLEANRKPNQKLFDAFYEEIERLKESNKELVEALDDNKAAADQAMRALERYGKGSQKKQEDLDLTEIAQCLYSIRNPDSEVFVKSEGDVNKKI